MEAHVAQRGIGHHVLARHDGEMLVLRRIDGYESDATFAEEIDRGIDLRLDHPIAITQFDGQRKFVQQGKEIVQLVEFVRFGTKGR